MGKYVFECSVKEIVLEKSKVTLHLIPDVGFSSKRKDDSGEKTFAVFQPMDGTANGKVFECGKFVKMEIRGQGCSWLANVGIGVESKLRIELVDDIGSVDNNEPGKDEKSGDTSSDITVDVPGIKEMAVTKIVIR